MVTQALGHNRLDIIFGHYVRYRYSPARRRLSITEKLGRFLPKGWPPRKNERCRLASQFTRFGRDKRLSAKSCRFLPFVWLYGRDYPM